MKVDIEKSDERDESVKNVETVENAENTLSCLEMFSWLKMYRNVIKIPKIQWNNSTFAMPVTKNESVQLSNPYNLTHTKEARKSCYLLLKITAVVAALARIIQKSDIINEEVRSRCMHRESR